MVTATGFIKRNKNIENENRTITTKKYKYNQP